MGIVEAVVVKVGDDTARGRSCSILLVAEAVQKMATTVKKITLAFNIVCECREDRVCDFGITVPGGVEKRCWR